MPGRRRLRARGASPSGSPPRSARLVEAADTERRRIEHNLHDGAQQRLTALVVQLRIAAGQARERARARARACSSPPRTSSRWRSTSCASSRTGSIRRCSRRSGSRRRSRRWPRESAIPIRLLELPAGTARPDRRGDRVLRGLRGRDQRAQARRRPPRSRSGPPPPAASCAWRSPTTGAAARTRPPGSGLQGLRDRVEAIGGTLRRRQPRRGGHEGARLAAGPAAGPPLISAPWACQHRAQRARRELLLAQERGGPAALHQLQLGDLDRDEQHDRCPGWRATIRRVASTPPMPGIRLSMITIRGASASTASIAASPSSASPASAQPGRGGDEVAQRLPERRLVVHDEHAHRPRIVHAVLPRTSVHLTDPPRAVPPDRRDVPTFEHRSCAAHALAPAGLALRMTTLTAATQAGKTRISNVV